MGPRHGGRSDRTGLLALDALADFLPRFPRQPCCDTHDQGHRPGQGRRSRFPSGTPTATHESAPSSGRRCDRIDNHGTGPTAATPHRCHSDHIDSMPWPPQRSPTSPPRGAQRVSSCFSPLDRLCLTPRPGAEPRSPHSLGPIAPLLDPPTFPQRARYLNTGFNTARFPPEPRPAALHLPMPVTLHGSPPLCGAPSDRYGPRVLWE